MRRAPIILVSATIFMLSCTTTLAQGGSTEEKTVTTTVTDGDTTTTVKIIQRESEDTRVLTNMVMIDPIKFMAWINVTYCRALSDHFSLGAMAQMATPVFSESTDGFGLQFDAVYYPSGKTFRGFHMGGSFSIASISQETFESPRPSRVTDTPITVGPVIGWTAWPGSEVSVDFSIGGDFTINNVSNTVWPYWMEDTGEIYPFFAFKVGYGW